MSCFRGNRVTGNGLFRRLLIGVAALLPVALLGVLAWWLYELGKVHGVEELAVLRREYSRLQEAHAELLAETGTLRGRIAVLDRSSSIDRQAAQEVQDELGALQDELQSLRAEVEFYQGIVAPGEVKPGLYLHEFTLEPEALPGHFHYDLVLTQLKRNDRYVNGVVEWNIAGETDGKHRELGLTEVTEDGAGQLKFRFRYFQHLAGTVVLPGDFRAQSVRLTVRPTGKHAGEPLEQVFDWPVAES